MFVLSVSEVGGRERGRERGRETGSGRRGRTSKGEVNSWQLWYHDILPGTYNACLKPNSPPVEHDY